MLLVFSLQAWAPAIYFVYLALSLWLLWLPSIYILRFAYSLVQHPRCRRCQLTMSLTSKWTRSVTSNTEVVLGYRDCVAALQEKMWQDAAKLLTVHGAEPAELHPSKLISTPLRYHLSFHECRTCSHHVARLTTDDLIDDAWHSRDQFIQSYWGTAVDAPSRLRRLRSVPSRMADIVAGSLRSADPIKINARLIGGIAFMVLIIGALSIQAWRAEHARGLLNSRSPGLSVDVLIAEVRA